MKKINKTTYHLTEDDLTQIVSWYFKEKRGIKNVVNDKIKFDGSVDIDGYVDNISADYTVTEEKELDL